MINLTLNHGVYVTREARDMPEATVALREWHPHLAVIDMDIGGGLLLQHLAGAGGSERAPVLALTRRGDLKTKLAAFEQGVDDIMTIPFSPEELLARVLVITRRALGTSVPFNPVQRLGELELHLTGLEQSLLYLLAARAGQGVPDRSPVQPHAVRCQVSPVHRLLDRDDPHHPRSFVDAADVAVLPGHRELTDKGLARRQRLRLKRLRTGR